jgi:hypothetical protein
VRLAFVYAYSDSHRDGNTKADPDTADSSNAACTPNAGASAMNPTVSV